MLFEDGEKNLHNHHFTMKSSEVVLTVLEKTKWLPTVYKVQELTHKQAKACWSSSSQWKTLL